MGNVTKSFFEVLRGTALWAVARKCKAALFPRNPNEVTYRYFRYDCNRFIHCSSDRAANTKDKDLAKLIALYHVLEKGLTMPERRMGFGRDAVLETMKQCETFMAKHGDGNRQAIHAAGVVRAYWELHAGWEGKAADADFWREVGAFVARHPDVPAAGQTHWTRKMFEDVKELPFPAFASSRHSVRNYAREPVPPERIRAAVELAVTAPSACNRQYVRVHCVGDKTRMEMIFSLQTGNRGFGHLADKLLLVTADLDGIFGAEERNDLFTNGGMFLMNLCYALHWHGIAHCVLNWSTSPENDLALRELVELKDSERVVALVACGWPPEEFDVATSPRKGVDEVLVLH